MAVTLGGTAWPTSRCCWNSQGLADPVVQVGQAQDMETGGRAFVAVDVHYLSSGGARAAAVVTADARFGDASG